MNSEVAEKMVDKLIARGHVFGKLTEEERANRVQDIMDTFQFYEDRIVYEVFVDYLNSHKSAPQPCEIIPKIEKLCAKTNKKVYAGERITEEQAIELRSMLKDAGLCQSTWLDYVTKRGTGPAGSGSLLPVPFQKFKTYIQKQLNIAS